MQPLIIFLGECNSKKDSLFQLLPNEFNEIVFENLKIKERIDSNGSKLLLINFPEEKEISQAFSSLLTLSQYFRITQIVFCLHYHQTIIQKVENIQKRFNQELILEVENISTFIISNSPSSSQIKNSRIYQFQEIDEINKKNIIRIFDDICSQNNYYSQIFLENKILSQQNESLRQRANILQKQFKDEFLSIYGETNLATQLEAKLQKLLSGEVQPQIKPSNEIYNNDIKLNQIILYSNAIQQLCYLKHIQNQYPPEFLGKWFSNYFYCSNCKVLYKKEGDKSILYDLSLFSLGQNENDNKIKNQKDKCFRCQYQLTQRILTILPIIEKIYFLKQIKNYLKIKEQHIEANKLYTQESKLQIKKKEDYIAILLLSDEEELKQFVMKKLHDDKNFKESNQFKEGHILNDSFYLIDTPIFSFDEDSDELESIYSNYINANPIHFIIFCLKLQRSSLIKERLLMMLKKFPNINRQAFSAFIIDQNNDNSEKQSCEYESINSIKRLIPQAALIQNSNTSMDVIKKISDFIVKVDKQKPISFQQTIFYKSDNDSDKNKIEESLKLISENIKVQFKKSCEQELKDEEARQMDKQQQQKNLLQKKSSMTIQFQEKQKELTDIIISIKQQLNTEESNYKNALEVLNNQLSQIEMDLFYSRFNIKEKKTQLDQMESEKIKKNYQYHNLTINQNRRTENRGFY
ncbi:unnamed protein product [Paramecium octaurelia]|uniref:Uncharacterized protein n=1 Tax=Paramecium octaurelia TaxID=43137 RepID=A0A8S1Y0V2_PAROT|nr:unnamed protein product [Paramecium octaurelia]